jgi:hypothetical protein
MKKTTNKASTSTKDSFKIAIPLDGPITFIYRDDLAPLCEGQYSIERVSNVEPCEGGWEARMINGPTLGPFTLRQQALDAEKEYLERKMFT